MAPRVHPHSQSGRETIRKERRAPKNGLGNLVLGRSVAAGDSVVGLSLPKGLLRELSEMMDSFCVWVIRMRHTVRERLGFMTTGSDPGHRGRWQMGATYAGATLTDVCQL
jgi:hypothetical protein